VRPSSALFFAVTACGGAPPPRVSPASTAAPPVAATRKAPLNTTALAVEPATVPLSQGRVRFVAPLAGERIAAEQAQTYELRWSSEQLDADALGLDIALDGNRPRRLPVAQSSTPLSSLVPVSEVLSPGRHWLFLAPVAASGVIPRRAADGLRSAMAVEFQVGAGPVTSAGKGALWLRKPDGTYNGPASEHVLFDAQAFAENGSPVAESCTFSLRGPATGELGVSAPFFLPALASGDYEIEAVASGFESFPPRRVTVNAELGRPK